MSDFHHISVLKNEAIEALDPQDGQVFIDATFGGGGHTSALLERANCQVIGIDQDPDALAAGQAIQEKFPNRLKLIQSRFSQLLEVKEKEDFLAVDGILFDFGVSSHQIDTAGRGFSFMQDGPLDMRMSQDGLSAEAYLHEVEEKELVHIIKTYGEEKAARKVARAIIESREEEPITTTQQLKSIVEGVLPRGKSKIHPATKTFQAIRMKVNQEIDEIEKVLQDLYKLLKVGGKAVFITFHSLEDRLIKQFLKEVCEAPPQPSRHSPFQEQNFQPKFKYLWRGAKKPSVDEIRQNPRARSAKLRGAERLSLFPK